MGPDSSHVQRQKRGTAPHTAAYEHQVTARTQDISLYSRVGGQEAGKVDRIRLFRVLPARRGSGNTVLSSAGSEGTLRVWEQSRRVADEYFPTCHSGY